MRPARWLVTAGALVLGCGPAPEPTVNPGPAPPPLPVLARADLPGLGARLFGEGLTAELEADDDGHVTQLRARKVEARAFLADGASFVDHAQAWMQTHGDGLGWGRLRAVAPSTSELPGFPGNAPRVVLAWPGADGCNGLVTVFDYSKGSVIALRSVTLVCPSAPGGAERVARLRQPAPPSPAAAASPAVATPSPPPAPHPGDPVADWLRGHGWSNVTATRPTAELLVMGVEKEPAPPAEPRRAFAVKLARDVAAASGFTGLDVVETSDFHNLDPRAPGRLRHVALHMSAPPLDGACIDPEVDVELGEPAGTTIPTDATYWLSEVRVLCEHEPRGGPRPPDAATRTLPKAAKRGLPFLAMCRSFDFNGGARSSGLVLDAKGDVYTFRGGRFTPPRTQRQLAVLLRHARAYAGTLPPADVDRLVELAPQVERETLSRKVVQAPDRPSSHCELFKPGASPADLGTIELDSASASGEAQRTGPLSSEVAKIIGRAHTVVEAGN